MIHTHSVANATITLELQISLSMKPGAKDPLATLNHQLQPLEYSITLEHLVA